MQTFITYLDVDSIAASLDNKRLGKQRVECKQIYLALQARHNGTKYGWKNHPAVKMWEGYEYWLICYAIYICREWKLRGFKDTLLPYFEGLYIKTNLSPFPHHIFCSSVISSHRAMLFHKNPEHYSKWKWESEKYNAYVWPVNPSSK